MLLKRKGKIRQKFQAGSEKVGWKMEKDVVSGRRIEERRSNLIK